MNIYNLKNDKLVNLQNEFKKTAFRKRTKMFSMLTTIFFIWVNVESIFLLLYDYKKNCQKNTSVL